VLGAGAGPSWTPGSAQTSRSNRPKIGGV
jgi:hypothetical protein